MAQGPHERKTAGVLVGWALLDRWCYWTGDVLTQSLGNEAERE